MSFRKQIALFTLLFFSFSCQNVESEERKSYEEFLTIKKKYLNIDPDYKGVSLQRKEITVTLKARAYSEETFIKESYKITIDSTKKEDVPINIGVTLLENKNVIYFKKPDTSSLTSKETIKYRGTDPDNPLFKELIEYLK